MVSYVEAMSLALKLARKGMGYVSPNPMVGAVIMLSGEIVSTGYHHKFGDIHAEVDAIRNAGDIDFSQATMAVNLEPCSHKGKQPPCASLLVSKGFKELVIGMNDPNPLVAGKGINILNDGGIKTTLAVLEEESRWLNRVFIKHITTGMPYIISKSAQSLNGAIATQGGDSKWISSEISRRTVHELRAEFDAVAVGKTTAVKDNPELTVRTVEGRNPYRIVFDTKLTIPEDYRIFSDEFIDKTVIVCSKEEKTSDKALMLMDRGIKLLFVETDDNGRISLTEAFKLLYQDLQIASILVEGGSILQNSLLEENLIDEYHIFIAPKIIANGLTAYNGIYSINKISESTQLKIIQTEKLGDDLHITCIKKVNKTI